VVDGHLHIVVSHPPRLPGGHQCQLVGGQRPSHPRRHDERHALEVALVEVAQQAAEQLGVGLRRPGQHPAKRRLAAGADRDQQGVVGQALAGAGDGDVVGGIDLGQHPINKLGANVRGDVRQRVSVRATAAERLGDRHRAVDEVRLGGEQRQLDAVPG
jgi:hypothetical protein